MGLIGCDCCVYDLYLSLSSPLPWQNPENNILIIIIIIIGTKREYNSLMPLIYVVDSVVDTVQYLRI